MIAGAPKGRPTIPRSEPCWTPPIGRFPRGRRFKSVVSGSPHQAPYRGGKLLRRNGLEKEGACAGLECHTFNGFIAETGAQDKMNRRAQTLQRRQELEAVHSRHHLIADYHVPRLGILLEDL